MKSKGALIWIIGSAALAVTMSDSVRARMGITGKSVAPVAAELKG